MKHISVIPFVAATLVAGAAVVALSPTRPGALASTQPEPTATATSLPAFPTPELAELDRVVQARFAVIPRDGNFGYGRLMVPVSKIHGRFYPATKPELAAVSGVANNKQQVVFALVGRKRFAGRGETTPRFQGPLVLSTAFPSPVVVGSAQDNKAFQKLVEQTRAIARSAPSQKELMPLAESVFASANPNEGAQKQIGEWRVIARSVPASSPECVTCHNGMAQAAAKRPEWKGEQPDLVSPHDPLGVALYCVRSASPAQSENQSPVAQQTH